MKSYLIKSFLLLSIIFVSIYAQHDESSLYKQRREVFISRMLDSSIAFFEAEDQKIRTNDIEYKFKQDPNFQYLTGVIEPKAFLILFKPNIILGEKKVSEILFVRESNKMFSRWVGELLGFVKAKEISGVDTVLNYSEFSETFKKYVAGRKYIYIGKEDYSFKKDYLTDVKYNFLEDRKNKLKELYPELKIKSANEILADMREVKSSEEIEKIRKAIDATVAGYIEAMKSCEPGLNERDIQAVIEYVFMRKGCNSLAFPSIVGSGQNALILHYENNNSLINDGDLLLMDIGAEYEGYSADLSRTIPANGKFTKEQKEIYSIVLKASEETIKIMLPGTKREDVEKKAADVIANGLLSLGIIKDKKDIRIYLPHGVSHNIGLDVHDISTNKPLREGQVVTIEPGIYIPVGSKGVDKKYWGIGVRIEDDVLITKEGNEVLTRKAPKSIEEIEKIMLKKGIGNFDIGSY